MSLSQTVRPKLCRVRSLFFIEIRLPVGEESGLVSDLAVVNNRSDEGPTLETSAFKQRNLIGKQS